MLQILTIVSATLIVLRLLWQLKVDQVFAVAMEKPLFTYACYLLQSSRILVIIVGAEEFLEAELLILFVFLQYSVQVIGSGVGLFIKTHWFIIPYNTLIKSGQPICIEFRHLILQ